MLAKEFISDKFAFFIDRCDTLVLLCSCVSVVHLSFYIVAKRMLIVCIYICRYGEEELRSVLSEEDYTEMSEKYNSRLQIEARLSYKVCTVHSSTLFQYVFF